MLFERLTKDNFIMFAIKHYDNPQAEGKKEFFDDMKRFKYLKRLLKRYETNGSLKERLIINHMIILSNVFGVEPAKVMMLYKIENKSWPVLKSFLSHLSMLSPLDLNNIEEDQKVKEILNG